MSPVLFATFPVASYRIPCHAQIVVLAALLGGPLGHCDCDLQARLAARSRRGFMNCGNVVVGHGERFFPRDSSRRGRIFPHAQFGHCGTTVSGGYGDSIRDIFLALGMKQADFAAHVRSKRGYGIPRILPPTTGTCTTRQSPNIAESSASVWGFQHTERG